MVKGFSDGKVNNDQPNEDLNKEKRGIVSILKEKKIT